MPRTIAPARRTASQRTAPTTRTAPVQYYTSYGALLGGGYTACIDIANAAIHGAGWVAMGADIGGLWLSRDYGKTWIPGQGVPPTSGFVTQNDRGIVSVKWSATHAGTLYCLIGTGSVGRLVSSQDYGATWSRATPLGISQSGSGQSNQPRPVGRLIAVVDGATASADTIYLGSANGVFKVTSLNTQTGPIVLSGARIFDLVMDPVDATKAYCVVSTTTGGNGILYRIDAIGTAPVATAIKTGAATDTYAGLQAINEAGATVLYMVAGASSGSTGGVWRCTAPATAPVFTQISASITDSRGSGATFDNGLTIWSGVDGFSSGVNRTVFVSSATPKNQYSSPWYQSTWKLTSGDSGATWAGAMLGQAADVNSTIFDSTGPTWWLNQHHPEQYLGRTQHTCAELVIDPSNTSRLMMAGRASGWHTQNALAASPAFYPLARPAVTNSFECRIDVTNPLRMVVGNSDWIYFSSANRFTDAPLQNDLITPANGYVGFSEWFEPSGQLVIGGGNRDGTSAIGGWGWIYTLPTPFAADPTIGLVDEGWTINRNSGGSVTVGSTIDTARVLRVMAGTDATGNRVLLAMADADKTNPATTSIGIWRKVGAAGQGTWTATASAKTVGTNNAAFTNINQGLVWGKGSQYVYATDCVLGILYRSSDYGVTWSTVWTFGPADNQSQGFLAQDPTTPNRLYLTTLTQIWRVDNAHDGTLNANGTNATGTALATDVTPVAITTPSAINCDSRGWVFACDLPGAAHLPGVYLSKDRGATWKEISDVFYKALNAYPTWMDVGPLDDYIVLTAIGQGVIVLKPIVPTRGNVP